MTLNSNRGADRDRHHDAGQTMAGADQCGAHGNQNTGTAGSANGYPDGVGEMAAPDFLARWLA